jgi:EXPERA (EXPanded EBP superfamily)
MVNGARSVADKFFIGFLAVDLYLALVIDTAGLQLKGWPPQPVKDVLLAYCGIIDPLFCAGNRWYKTMLTVEAITYPPYIVAALITLWNGVVNSSDAFEIATCAWTTMNVYSVLVIGAEGLSGNPSWRSSKPTLFALFHAPFAIIPMLFLRHVWLTRRRGQVTVKQS